MERPDATPQSAGTPQCLDEIRRQAREQWMRLRQGAAQSSAGAAQDRGHDDDLVR
jgi:hypothetical protein